eukprot:12246858-Alexandrium_andersonii.AAC.2
MDRNMCWVHSRQQSTPRCSPLQKVVSIHFPVRAVLVPTAIPSGRATHDMLRLRTVSKLVADTRIPPPIHSDGTASCSQPLVLTGP